ncbi:uncharacterized protein LOC126703989 [Quercus robur]|uniref:uncharacterized protein LOC126703989 n=1 Tax=Quercus robur TaxID=38942 RepID=UPI0021611AF3|nr:uncharacterized protein LOC126703989 [Quercus robur]
MKRECLTYLKTIGKSKALVATLSDTEPEDDSDNDDEGILNAFTIIVDPTDGGSETVDDEEDLTEQGPASSEATRIETVTPPASSVPSTSTSSSLVNTCVCRIARRQACLGGFLASPSLSLEPSEDEDDDGDSDDDDDDEDEDSSFSDNEMAA